MSKPASNPFFEADFSKYMDVSKMLDMSKMMDVSKMLGEFKMPNMNIEAVMASHRKNIEALTSANQLAFENLQTFARRQAELVRQHFESTAGIVQGVMTASTADEKMAKQAEATKAALDRNLMNLRELTDMMTKNQYQALEVVSKRMSEGMDELQSIVKSATPAA